MFSFYNKHNNNLYNKLVELSRNIYFYKELSLKDSFEAMAKEAGLNGINGHRSVGGYRASMYNALPIESVQVLVDIMKTLEQNA